MSYQTVPAGGFQAGAPVDTNWEDLKTQEKIDLILNDKKRLKKIGIALGVVILTIIVLFGVAQVTTGLSIGYANAKAYSLTPWGTEWRNTDHVGKGGVPVYSDKGLSEGRRLFMGRRLEETAQRDWLLGLAQNISETHLETLKGRLPADANISTEGHVKGGVPEIVIAATLKEIKEIIKDIEGIMYVEQDCPGELVPDEGETLPFRSPSGPANGNEASNETGDEDSNASTGRRMADSIIEIYTQKIRRLQAEERRLPGCEDAQSYPDWGLDRADSRESLDYKYGCHANSLTYGEGVHVYVVDTGIRYTHEDFEGRAFPALSWASKRMEECKEDDLDCGNDDNGHGTHCAALVGGRLYGVAKKATLHSVRTFAADGTMYISWALQAIDWVMTHAKKPAIMSMSIQMLGTWKPGLDAITEATEKGLPIVVAAGNAGLSDMPEACDYSPAYVPSAITVGSIDRGDMRSAFSNYGSCIDLFAPGRDIRSASHLSDDGFKVYSGTSQACPMVAGAAALLLGHKKNLTVRQLTTLLKEGATDDLVSDKGARSPNKILFVGPGFETLADETAMFEEVSGGKDQACRGRNEADGDIYSSLWAAYWGQTAYEQVETPSVDECKQKCIESKSCTGIDYQFEDKLFGGKGTCKVWNRDIGTSTKIDGYECWRYKR